MPKNNKMSECKNNNNFVLYDRQKMKALIEVSPTNKPLSTGNTTSRKL